MPAVTGCPSLLVVRRSRSRVRVVVVLGCCHRDSSMSGTEPEPKCAPQRLPDNRQSSRSDDRRILGGHGGGDGCRVEWLKSRARSLRWLEESKFLAEEMRRTPITLEVKASWWDARRESEDESLGSDIKEGIRAYASQQAAVCRKLALSFKAVWDVEGIDIPEGADEWEEIDDPEEGGESEDETLVDDE
ncbi:hypothetical protein BDZ89DRAFT_1170920 [Hymenopellis radicata]|nr:hypothetical protein BDZ89DRAFT_1170920 [Hymenopellis radicata]